MPVSPGLTDSLWIRPTIHLVLGYDIGYFIIIDTFEWYHVSLISLYKEPE